MKRIIIFILEALLFLFVIGIIVFSGWVIYANTQVDSIENRPITNVTGEIISVNGYDLHVQIFGTLGNQTPIVLLHDFDAAGGQVLNDLARALSTNRPVIVPDLLGFGFSERVTEAGDHYSHAGQSAHIAALLDTLAVGQVDLVGHSYGGAIAVQFALDNPNRVQHLALISADIYPQDFNLLQTLETLPIGIGRAFTFTFLGGGSADYSHESETCFNCRPNPRNAYVFIADTTDALLANQQSPQNSQALEGLASLNIPVALIWGQNDPIVPVAYAERLIEEAQVTETLILSDAGHYPYQDNLAEVVETLLYAFAQ